jgi:hypothetical protein
LILSLVLTMLLLMVTVILHFTSKCVETLWQSRRKAQRTRTTAQMGRAEF